MSTKFIDKRTFKPMVSIIIPTHKGMDLSKLLESISNSTYKNIEIIIINEGKERSEQRNIGIKKAKGKFLFLPDSDWVITQNLISECVKLMEQCDAVYIPEIIKTKGLFAKIRNWERQFYTATPIDVVRFVKAPCPLFDENMSGPEDSHWDRRVIGKRMISNNPYYHYDNVSFIRFFKKKAYYSKSMNKFKEKNKRDKILNLKWRCLDVFIENGKWRRFISNPAMALCVLLTILLRGVIYKCTPKS